MSGEPILEVRDLAKVFPVRRGAVLRRTVGQVQAVDGVSFVLWRGRTLGLVGESGSGKSTLARMLVGVERPSRGEVLVHGVDVTTMSRAARRELRRRVQIVFQDPYTSLNPRMSVGEIVGEPYRIHPRCRSQRWARPGGQGAARARRSRPGPRPPISPPVLRRAASTHRYRQGAGGQAAGARVRRAGLGPRRVRAGPGHQPARGPPGRARFVVPVHRPRPGRGATHRRRGLRDVSRTDRRARHRGRGYDDPTHPYTRALVSAVPVPDPTARLASPEIVLEGDIPSPADPPSGCRFHTRCWLAAQLAAGGEPAADGVPLRCSTESPPLTDTSSVGHLAACHYAERTALTAAGIDA